MKFIKNFKKFLAFVFSFFIFVPNFNPNVHANGNINILIVGGKEVGKSTLLHRIVTQDFDNPINKENVPKYEHGKIYSCVKDYRIKVAEMDFEDKSLVPEYKDYLYQNANVIIHMSHVRDLPDKQAVSNWYDKFVRTILKGQKEAENWELLGSIFGDSNDVDGYESSIKNFKADPEDVPHRRVWFGPLQLKCKIGYIIFVFNGSDNPNVFDNCQELWDFIGDFPNSRSILHFDSLSSNGDGTTIHGVQKNLVTLNEWIHSTSTLSSFEAYDDSEKKKLFYHQSQENLNNLKNGSQKPFSNSNPRQKVRKISKPTKCFCCSCIVSGILFLISFITDMMCCESDSDEENLIIKGK